MRLPAAALLSTFLLLQFTTYAQSFTWAKQISSSTHKTVNDITVDDKGNVYTVGYFYNVADFDPGPGEYILTTDQNVPPGGITHVDMFVSKLDSSGNFLWAIRFGGPDIDVASEVTVDKEGNVYIQGSFRETVDFDPGAGVFNMTSAGDADMALIKLDASGNLLFAKQIGGRYTDYARALQLDGSGNILIVFDTGVLGVDFDPGPSVFNLPGQAETDIAICKLSPTGDFLWAKHSGGTDIESVSTMVIDKDNNIIITGYFYGTCDFDPGPVTFNLTSAGGADIFVTKLDASGNFVWAKRMGGSGSQNISDLTIDPSGNILMTGYSEEQGDFDPGAGVLNLTAAGGRDILLLKMDPQGNLIWAKLIGSLSDEGGGSLAIDQAGTITLAGGFNSTVDFDPGNGIAALTPVGYYDIFICTLTSSGGFISVKQIGGKRADWFSGLSMDKSENLYVTGGFQDEVDFDPGPGVYKLISRPSVAPVPHTLSSDYDIFILKLGKSNQITGTVFSDANGDGIRQATELRLPNIPVQATRRDLIYQVRSDSSGRYVIQADTGSYSITVPSVRHYTTVTPSVHHAEFNSLFGRYDPDKDFALQPVPNVKDLRVALTNVTATRRGFTTVFWLTYQNTGTVPLSGTVTISHENALSFILSTPAQSNYAAGNITYNFTNLAPSEQRNVEIRFSVSRLVPLNDTLETVATITPVAGDAAPTDNIDTLRTPVTGSFDPNDKSVTPFGPITPAYISKGGDLDYTIRFQNTGNDTAFTVIIKDTLSGNVDHSTIQMISSSHSYTSVQKDNIIEWKFENILLPDSNINEAKSHGFIRFRIKPKNTVMVGETIKNKAAIYFDFNDPVITNETNTPVQEMINNSAPDSSRISVRIYPNPTDRILNVKMKGAFQYTLYTPSGQMVMPLSSATDEANINTQQLMKGVYFLKLIHSSGRFSFQVVVQ